VKVVLSNQRIMTAADGSVLHLAVSWVLMIPLVCFASTGIPWFWTGGSSELTARFGVLANAETGTAGNTAITLLLFAFVSVLLFPKINSVVELCRRDRLFALLAAWIMVSCLWSQFPVVSLEWAPVAVLNIVFAFYLYRRFSPNQQMRLLFVLGWICLILSIVLSLFFPRYGIDYAGDWRGIYQHKNMCSMTTAFLLLPSLYAPASSVFSKVARLLYVGLSAFLIIMTQSATGRIILVCLLAYFVMTRFASRLRAKERTIPLIMGIMIALAFVGVGISNAGEILLFLGKDPTLTGRTEIWKSVIPSIMKHPILGYGYKAFWRGYQGESANASLATHWAVNSAHNGFLEVWLTLGAVGVVFVAYSLLRAVRDAFVCLREAGSPYLAWYACVIFLTIITSLDEGQLVIPNSLVWILYIVACLGLYEGARSIRLGLDRG
jgi:exopolysaccharide production protein ExoQ